MTHAHDDNSALRITVDPEVMAGAPCIREMRITAKMVWDLLQSGAEESEILSLYPALEPLDLDAVREYFS